MSKQTTAEIVVGLSRLDDWLDGQGYEWLVVPMAADRLSELLIEIGRLQQENESLKAISGRSGVA